MECVSVYSRTYVVTLLGHNFQKLHNYLTIDMGGTKPDLIISNTSPCALSTATIDNISLFTNLLPECKPIATKSRRFSFDDKDFIQGEIDRLLSGGIIEPSTSPWRAQIVVVKNGTQSVKKRLCVDYSQTINLYTELDAYPLPRIDTMINKLAQYKVFRHMISKMPIIKFLYLKQRGNILHLKRVDNCTSSVAYHLV